MAILSGKVNLTFLQGATYNVYIHWTDVTGSAIDLTGYSGRMKVKSSKNDDATLYLSLSSSLQSDGTGLSMSGSYLDPVSPTEGKIGIYISAASSSQLDFGENNEGVYDLELESPSGFVTRLIEGNAKLSTEVTD